MNQVSKMPLQMNCSSKKIVIKNYYTIVLYDADDNSLYDVRYQMPGWLEVRLVIS